MLVYAGLRGVSVIETFRSVLAGQPPPAYGAGSTAGALVTNNAPITPYNQVPGENTSPKPGFGTTYPSLLTPGTTIGG